MIKVCSFGEIFIKLASSKDKVFAALPDKIDFSFYSPEVDFLVNIANLGGRPYFISSLPLNYIGDSALRFLDRFRINRDYVKLMKNGRMSINFIENSNFCKMTKFIYERQSSTIDNLKAEDIPFQTIFSKTNHYHISGFTSGLSKETMNTIVFSARIAKEIGLEVSCNLNYNQHFWKYEVNGEKVNSKEIISDLAVYCDYLFFNEIDIREYFGIDIRKKENDKDQLAYYQNLLLKVSKMFPNIKIVVLYINNYCSHGFREIGGALYLRETNQFFFSPNIFNKFRPVEIKTPPNKNGGIEAFSAGFIFSLKKYKNLQHVLDFAVASSVLKYSYNGDYNYNTFEKVTDYIHSQDFRRIRRG